MGRIRKRIRRLQEITIARVSKRKDAGAPDPARHPVDPPVQQRLPPPLPTQCHHQMDHEINLLRSKIFGIAASNNGQNNNRDDGGPISAHNSNVDNVGPDAGKVVDNFVDSNASNENYANSNDSRHNKNNNNADISAEAARNNDEEERNYINYMPAGDDVGFNCNNNGSRATKKRRLVVSDDDDDDDEDSDEEERDRNNNGKLDDADDARWDDGMPFDQPEPDEQEKESNESDVNGSDSDAGSDDDANAIIFGEALAEQNEDIDLSVEELLVEIQHARKDKQVDLLLAKKRRMVAPPTNPARICWADNKYNRLFCVAYVATEHMDGLARRTSCMAMLMRPAVFASQRQIQSRLWTIQNQLGADGWLAAVQDERNGVIGEPGELAFGGGLGRRSIIVDAQHAINSRLINSTLQTVLALCFAEDNEDVDMFDIPISNFRFLKNVWGEFVSLTSLFSIKKKSNKVGLPIIDCKTSGKYNKLITTHPLALQLRLRKNHSLLPTDILSPALRNVEVLPADRDSYFIAFQTTLVGRDTLIDRLETVRGQIESIRCGMFGMKMSRQKFDTLFAPHISDDGACRLSIGKTVHLGVGLIFGFLYPKATRNNAWKLTVHPLFGMLQSENGNTLFWLEFSHSTADGVKSRLVAYSTLKHILRAATRNDFNSRPVEQSSILGAKTRFDGYFDKYVVDALTETPGGVRYELTVGDTQTKMRTLPQLEQLIGWKLQIDSLSVQRYVEHARLITRGLSSNTTMFKGRWRKTVGKTNCRLYTIWGNGLGFSTHWLGVVLPKTMHRYYSYIGLAYDEEEKRWKLLDKYKQLMNPRPPPTH